MLSWSAMISETGLLAFSSGSRAGLKIETANGELLTHADKYLVAYLGPLPRCRLQLLKHPLHASSVGPQKHGSKACSWTSWHISTASVDDSFQVL